MESLGIPDDASPAYISLPMLGHTLARAALLCSFESESVAESDAAAA